MRAQRVPLIGRLASFALGLYGVEIPREVHVAASVRFAHKAFGTVVHPQTRIGENVTIYHRVTIARSNSWVPDPASRSAVVDVRQHAVLCPGSVVLFRHEDIVVGEGTVLGANSVLTCSTGDWEIWAGSPARRVGERLDRPLER